MALVMHLNLDSNVYDRLGIWWQPVDNKKTNKLSYWDSNTDLIKRTTTKVKVGKVFENFLVMEMNIFKIV